jgi:hypothetical protein
MTDEEINLIYSAISELHGIENLNVNLSYN